MKNCKHCGNEVAKSAKVCPKCGGKLGKSKLLVFGIVLLVIIIGAAVGGNSSSTKPEEKFSYSVTKQYLDSAGFAYYVEGTVENKLDKDYSYVQIEFICYDKDGNNLGTALDNTNNLLAKQTWKFKAIGTFVNEKNVDHCDYHEITGW